MYHFEYKTKANRIIKKSVKDRDEAIKLQSDLFNKFCKQQILYVETSCDDSDKMI